MSFGIFGETKCIDFVKSLLQRNCNLCLGFCSGSCRKLTISISVVGQDHCWTLVQVYHSVYENARTTFILYYNRDISYIRKYLICTCIYYICIIEEFLIKIINKRGKYISSLNNKLYNEELLKNYPWYTKMSDFF